jgi:hemolysin III
LRGGWGWTLFALEWGLAVVGIAVEQRSMGKRRILPVVIYVVMGWMIVPALRPLLHVLPWQGVVLMVVGGLFYTGGIVFYAIDKRFTWAHGVWHLCVLAGSISHYVAVLQYVV